MEVGDVVRIISAHPYRFTEGGDFEIGSVCRITRRTSSSLHEHVVGIELVDGGTPRENVCSLTQLVPINLLDLDWMVQCIG